MMKRKSCGGLLFTDHSLMTEHHPVPLTVRDVVGSYRNLLVQCLVLLAIARPCDLAAAV